MTQISLPMKRLLWKDCRLILPLVALLLGLSTLFHILYALSIRDDYLLGSLVQFMLNVVPAGYAVGAGAILINREKETESLRWLGSLPISPTRIIVSKLIVAIGCLAMVWIVSVVLYASTSMLRSHGTFLDSAHAMSGYKMILTSTIGPILLLVIGNWVSWRLKSSMISVVMIILIVCRDPLVCGVPCGRCRVCVDLRDRHVSITRFYASCVYGISSSIGRGPWLAELEGKPPLLKGWGRRTTTCCLESASLGSASLGRKIICHRIHADCTPPTISIRIGHDLAMCDRMDGHSAESFYFLR